jgi:hypothetical protein
MEIVSRRHGGLGVIVTVMRCGTCRRAVRVQTETPRLVTDGFRRAEQRRRSELAVMRAQETRFVAQLRAGEITPDMFAPRPDSGPADDQAA